MQVSRGSRAGLGESERREMPPMDKEAKQAFNFTAMLDRLSTEDKHTHTHIFVQVGWGVCVPCTLVRCWVWMRAYIYILYVDVSLSCCTCEWMSVVYMTRCCECLWVRVRQQMIPKTMCWWWWGHGGDDAHRKEEVGKPDRCCASPPHYHHDHCHRPSTLRWRRLFHHRVAAKTVDENETV